MSALPEWSIEITPTFVVSTAISTRDFQDVHHDKARAIELGSKDIFVNILTSQGLVQRYITDSLGHDIEIRSIDIRLGAPAHPGDTLAFSGNVESEADGFTTIRVRGDVAVGAHITGTVVVRR
ncbi:MAG: beta-hydroxyacyl-ACP dehydratase [Marmoricola sp.]